MELSNVPNFDLSHPVFVNSYKSHIIAEIYQKQKKSIFDNMYLP